MVTAQPRQRERKLWYVFVNITTWIIFTTCNLAMQLKKRQQKKAGGPNTGIASPPASPSLRALSPAPSEVPPMPEAKGDFGDVYVLVAYYMPKLQSA